VERWDISRGIIGANAPSWLTFEVHRPYFDGAESPATVVQAKSVILSASRFEQRAPLSLRFGMTMPASYRRLLVQESGMVSYRISGPTDLAEDLASPSWRRMADAYRDRAGLDPVDRVGLAQWLVAACLPKAVLDLAPTDLAPDTCQDPLMASLQSARAVALFAIEGLSERTAAAYRPLVEHPAATATHVQSLAGWGYLLARHAGDASAAPLLLARARELLKGLAAELTPFEHAVLTTRLTLREVMDAERRQEFTQARALLAAAQGTVAELSADNPQDALLLLESRRRLLDRSLEIAVRSGDTETEQRELAAGLALDPTCVKIRMQAAQAAERAGEHEQALAGYLHAARLGPYGTAFALLRAAECARTLGHREFARVLNERAFRAAPRATATRDALVQVALADDDRPLADVVCRAAVRDPEHPYGNNWHYQMYASYFNLGESQSPGLYARLPTLAFEFAERGARPDLNWQRLMPPAFRSNLVRESGLTDFAVTHPADLPAALRTRAWNTLCEWVEGFADHDTEQQHRIAVVLFRLGFGSLVLDLVPMVPAAQLDDPAELRLQHWRDLIRYVGSVGGAVVTPENSFAVARHPNCPVYLRYAVAAFAVVFHARHTRSIEEVTAWRALGERNLALLLAEPDRPAFEKAMLESRFYRSVSYLPFLLRDRARLAEDMERAEELARSAPAEGEYQEFLKRENLRACLESRSKESFGFGEDEDGHALIEQVLALDPYEPKSHIERGESLFKQERLAEAADSYLRTARLGPVSTALGYAAAGQCFERAALPVLAEDCYLQTLRLDPYAITAARGWERVAPTGGMAETAAQYRAGLETWGTTRRAARDGRGE
jgi:tetratricopeptide (TPR) repeat protein